MRRRCFTRAAPPITDLGSRPSGSRRDLAQCNSAHYLHALPCLNGWLGQISASESVNSFGAEADVVRGWGRFNVTNRGPLTLMLGSTSAEH